MDLRDLTPHRLWLCPHESINFEQAQRLALYHPPDADYYYYEEMKPTCTMCRDNTISNYIRHKTASKSTSLITTIPMWRVSAFENAEACIRQVFTPPRVEQLLLSLDLPICAHLRTCDWQVATCYRGYNMFTRSGQAHIPYYCFNNRSNAISSDAPHMAACLKCHRDGTHTLFGFSTVHHLSNGKTFLSLEFDVVRDLTGLENIDSSSWRLHSFKPAILAEITTWWPIWEPEKAKITQLWTERPVGVPQNRASPYSAQVQERRGHCRALLNQIFRTRQPQQTARTVRQAPFKDLSGTAAAECDIDRCCITWNATRRPIGMEVIWQEGEWG